MNNRIRYTCLASRTTYVVYTYPVGSQGPWGETRFATERDAVAAAEVWPLPRHSGREVERQLHDRFGRLVERETVWTTAV